MDLNKTRRFNTSLAYGTTGLSFQRGSCHVRPQLLSAGSGISQVLLLLFSPVVLGHIPTHRGAGRDHFQRQAPLPSAHGISEQQALQLCSVIRLR